MMIDLKDRILATLLASILIDFISIGLVTPLLPFYAQSFEASSLEVGVLLGLASLMGIVTPTLWGNLSDRIGRRPALLFNIAGTTLSYLWLGFANSLWMLFTARILAGASSSSITIAQSYVADLTTTHHRTKRLSFLEAASATGSIFGLAIGGLLVGGNMSNPNFRLPSLVATVISGLTFSAAFVTLPRSRNRATISQFNPHPQLQKLFCDLKKTLQRPLVGITILVVFAKVLSIRGIETISALWCEQRFGWGPQQFCAFMLLYFLAIVTIQIGFISRLTRTFGEIKLLFLSLSISTLGLWLLPFSTTIPQLIIAMIFLVVGEATSMPIFTSLLSRLSGAKQQGKTLGLMQSVSGIGGFLGASGAGLIFGTLGKNWPCWISAVLMTVATIICWIHITQTRFLEIMRHRRWQKIIYIFELFHLDNSEKLEFRDSQKVTQNLMEPRESSPKMAGYKALKASFTLFWEMLRRLTGEDSNRKIDLAKWLTCLEQQIDKDFANTLLHLIDTNRDGKVTVEEIKLFYQAYSLNIKDLGEVFHILDLNQDGHISRDEFEILFSQFLYSDDVQAPGNWLFGTTLPMQL
ncbi:MAG: MFS transporter [Cyanobacteria bacterium P01_F01_bin.86]